MKVYEESKHSIKAILSKQQKELNEREERFHHVGGNPDHDKIRLEEVMKNKMEEPGRNLKESLMEEVKKPARKSKKSLKK